MQLPRISIVTPSFNQGAYIERTVRSVLLQRYPALEYVFMDGGSTDDTMERVRPYWPYFSYAVSERDAGQADAIRRGFEKTSGEIMAYLNSDDLLGPGTLHFVADYFARNPDVDVLYSHRVTINDDDRVINYWLLPRHSSYLMSRWDLIPQETCFWRRRIFDRCGNVDASFRFAMDYDLFVRFMQAGRWRRVNRFLGAFRYHATAKSTVLLHTVGQEEIKRVREKYHLNVTPRREVIGKHFVWHVQAKARRFVRGRRVLPGCMPGIGWDYNDLWGGLLRDTSLPPRLESGAVAQA